MPLFRCEVDDIRQIIFTLRVAGSELLQGAEKKLAVDHIGAHVDFSNRLLLCIGVSILDDTRDSPLDRLRAHNPPVPACVFEHRGQDGDGSARCLMNTKKFAHSRFLKQRCIAVQNQITGWGAVFAHREHRAAL